MRQYEIGINEYNRLLVHIDKTFKYDTEKIRIYKVLVKGLKTYENKVINIRIEKVVQNVLKEYNVNYSKWYGWYRIYVSRQNPYTQFEIILASKEKVSKRTYFKIDYLKEKLKELEEKHKKDVLNFKNVSEIVGKYNSALRYFKEAERELCNIPDWFSFNRF